MRSRSSARWMSVQSSGFGFRSRRFTRRPGRVVPATGEHGVEIPHQAAIEEIRAAGLEDDSEGNGRLLLAEDNEINQMVAVELLQMSGWTVDVAGNGLEAVAAAQRNEYDAILMDCQMPEMDGLTAAREIRFLEAAGRLPRHSHELIPIIAFTANRRWRIASSVWRPG